MRTARTMMKVWPLSTATDRTLPTCTKNPEGQKFPTLVAWYHTAPRAQGQRQAGV
jgi:hypothetical protein